MSTVTKPTKVRKAMPAVATAKPGLPPAREGYKHTKLGWIPEEWEMNRIGPKIDLLVGYPFASTGYSQTGVRLLRCNNIKRGETSWDESVTVCWPKSSANLKRYEMQVGDLVIAMDGSLVGKSYALLSEGDLPALLLQRVARVRSKDIDTEYLKHWVGSNYFVRYCDSVKTVTAIPHIGHKDIQDWVLPIPPLPEQRRIAAVLGAWDRAIATVQQLLAAQQERKRGLMQELLTGRRRFKGFGGKWKPTRFDEIFSPKKEKAGTREFEVLSVTTKGLVSQAKYFDRKVASEDRSNYLVVRKGDFVFSGLNFWMGSVDLVWDFEVGIISPAYKCFVVDQAVMHLDYARWFVRSQVMLKALVKSSIQGASIVRRNLDGEQLAAWLFDLPAREEQRKIADALTACDLEVRTLEQELDHLTTQKRGLMQQLLMGAVRVKY